MRRLCFVVVPILLITCGCQSFPTEEEKIHIQKTEHCVTFTAWDSGYRTLIDRVQNAAERWIRENPAYDVKSSAVDYSDNVVLLMLYVEKKR